jgi:hypothetical protein
MLLTDSWGKLILNFENPRVGGFIDSQLRGSPSGCLRRRGSLSKLLRNDLLLTSPALTLMMLGYAIREFLVKFDGIL